MEGDGLSTFRNSDHKRICLLATASSLRMGAFGQGASSLGYFHHESVEMLTF